jgi:hypothetical protein
LTAAPADAAEVSRPFLSVLVRTQGTGLRQQTIRDTLVCLAAQSDLDFEVLVLAHRVGADERHTLASTVDEFEPLLPGRLRVLEVTEPGRSTPLRVGAKAARGDYVAILDDDDTVLAHWVESFHDLARRAERPAVLRCRSVSQRMEILDRGVAGPGYRAWTEWDAPWSSRFDAMEQLTDNHMPIHSYALPRVPLLGWGLTWDPALPVLEDWDLLMRAVNALGVVDGAEFTSIYRLWPTTVNSQASTDATQWAQVREGLLDRWDRLAWVVPSPTRCAAGSSGWPNGGVLPCWRPPSVDPQGGSTGGRGQGPRTHRSPQAVDAAEGARRPRCLARQSDLASRKGPPIPRSIQRRQDQVIAPASGGGRLPAGDVRTERRAY